MKRKKRVTISVEKLLKIAMYLTIIISVVKLVTATIENDKEITKLKQEKLKLEIQQIRL